MSDPAMSGVWPGRRPSIKDVAFDGFPADGGLWWLRWMDYGAATTTSRSSFLHLLFSRLPDGTRPDALPLLEARLAARSSAFHHAEAHVGWLPVMRIGLVVQAGMVVGELGAELRRFRFEVALHEEATSSPLTSSSPRVPRWPMRMRRTGARETSRLVSGGIAGE